MANIQVNKTAHPFDKTRFEALLNRRFFYAPAFEIYGGEYYDHHESRSISVLQGYACLEHGCDGEREGMMSLGTRPDSAYCSCTVASARLGFQDWSLLSIVKIPCASV